MKNRGSLLKTLTRFDRSLEAWSKSVETASVWTLNSADEEELARVARRIARLQLSISKLSRDLASISREIRTLVADTARCLTMPVAAKRKAYLSRTSDFRQRSAFAAVSSKSGAFVARVLEDTPRVWPQREYGRFETWTQAQGFATMLNQQYGLDAMEVRHIVVSAGLAAAKSRGHNSQRRATSPFVCAVL